MARFAIKEIRLHRLILPLKSPFSTHLQTVKERESILVEMIDEEGTVGFGECVAFSSPWYTEETIQTCWDALANWLIPAVLHKTIQKPADLYELMKPIKGNRMAKAALDIACWDVFAKREKKPLWHLIGGSYQQIPAGIVHTGPLDSKSHYSIEKMINRGYKRIKFKIDGETNLRLLKELVDTYPSLYFFADANGIFSQLGMDALLPFDELGLSLIEQPFEEDDWSLLQEAREQMETPIALDESIRSISDVERMIELKAGDVIVLKPGRVGGITESLAIHALAIEYDIPMWIGGMIELGVSKAHNLALASLPQMKFPGDFSASNHFWKEDVITPIIDIQDGQIPLLEEAGIGYTINNHVAKNYIIQEKIWN